MRRNLLLADVAMALALAGLVLILSPGLAIVAILAALVALGCGVSFVLAGVRRRRRRRPRRSRRSQRSLSRR